MSTNLIAADPPATSDDDMPALMPAGNESDDDTDSTEQPIILDTDSTEQPIILPAGYSFSISLAATDGILTAADGHITPTAHLVPAAGGPFTPAAGAAAIFPSAEAAEAAAATVAGRVAGAAEEDAEAIAAAATGEGGARPKAGHFAPAALALFALEPVVMESTPGFANTRPRAEEAAALKYFGVPFGDLPQDKQDDISNSVFEYRILEKFEGGYIHFGTVVPTHGFSVIKNFAQDHLGFDPNTLIAELKDQYPVRMPGDAIVPATPQWIHGSHPALNYRGNAIRRHKMWFQEGDPLTQGWRKYGYTGWQNRILPATSDWNGCPTILPIVQALKTFYRRNSIMDPNHGIITKYVAKTECIGAHSDKAHTIEPSSCVLRSMICVIKAGPGSRPFVIEDLEGNVIFSKVLSPGTAVFMTVEDNLTMKHSVPAVSEAQYDGPSGSIVFRTIASRISNERLTTILSKTTYKDCGGEGDGSQKRPSEGGGGGGKKRPSDEGGGASAKHHGCECK